MVLGGLFLVLSVAFSTWMVIKPRGETTFKAEAGLAATTASLFPQKGMIFLSSKETLPVGVLVESGDKMTERVDLVIGFDPKLAEVESLIKGTLFDDYVVTKVDNIQGEMLISAVNERARAANGILASFRIRAKMAGTAEFRFKQSAGVEKAFGGTYTVTK